MHTYILRNTRDRAIEIKLDGRSLVRLEPNSTLHFFSPYDDLEPLFITEGIEYSVESIEIDPEFLAKCRMVELEENCEWKEDGF